MKPTTLPQRQIHLDFHNSPFIPGICENFDAPAFARTLREAAVDSVTVFARCIHGMAYYPTRFGQMHPHLNGRDFLGEAIQALHAEGIRAPIYVTIAWEEGVASDHPAWRQMTHDGRFATMNTDMDANMVPGSQWRLNDFIHPDYMDYIEGYLDEITTAYPVDGIFLDMLFYGTDAGWSEPARAFRKEHGLLEPTPYNHVKFESLAQQHFAKRMTAAIQRKAPQATVFYNTPNNLYIDRTIGASARWDWQSHIEVESLPSGIWGYNHFPKIGRRLFANDKLWLGMTGRFQKMWGDFGGIKPQPALEYECFRTQALGGANSVGDQLLPDGRLDPDAYELIGAVYRQCAAAEDFYRGSEPCPEVGILCPNHPELNEASCHLSEEGAVQLMQELRYDCAVLDAQSDFSPYALLILPDSVRVDASLRSKLTAFVAAGGRILASYRSGEEAGRIDLGGESIPHGGDTTFHPNYWRPKAGQPLEGLCSTERVFYSRGLDIESDPSEVWIERIEPYFQRNDLHFCSHFQTPPSGRVAASPSLIRRGSLLYFADPVFREYRQKGNHFVADCLRAALAAFYRPPILSGLKSTIECYPRKRGNDLLLTLLHYLPVRKSVEADIVAERHVFDRERLTFDRPVRAVIDSQSGKTLEASAPNCMTLLPGEGRCLLEIPDYFNT